MTMWLLLLLDPVILSLSLVGVIVWLLYYYGTNNYNYWKEKSIPYIKPKYPFLGNLYEVVFSLKCIHEKQQEIYNHFKGKPFGGIFLFTTPELFIKDPSFVETVLIKDFTTFSKRNETINNVKKVPGQAHLLNLEDQEWRSLRQKLSPTFTSGKLKVMHPQLVECADILVKYISDYVNTSEPIDVREIMAKFTTDVIGSCAFGLHTNTINDPDSEFRKIGKRIFHPSFITKLKMGLLDYAPKFIAFLIWLTNPLKKKNFFVTILNNTISYREKNNIIRNDFVQLLMELKKQEMEKQKNGLLEDDHFIIDDNVIVSNAFVFFVAGFETTASTLSYCLYHLSVEQDIQEEAYKHIISVLKKHGGEVTYDAIKEMTLIHNIFAETLRMHPPAPELRRISTREFVIPGTTITLPKGTPLIIPHYSLQNDPDHFPEPEKFKPERFTEKENIKKGTYIPFSDGPRICIGKRFAEMEMRVALVKLLLNYKFKLNPKTISPLVYDPYAFLLIPLGGIWVDLEKRI